MSGKAKNSLGTVVECSETGEEAPESAPIRQNGAAKSREKAKRRATFGGSRLSLHTLLFSSNREKEKYAFQCLHILCSCFILSLIHTLEKCGEVERWIVIWVIFQEPREDE